MNKKITFLHMSKGFKSKNPNGNVTLHNPPLPEPSIKKTDVITRSNGTLPFSHTNYFDILREATKTPGVGSANCVFLQSKEWMNTFCAGRELGLKKVSDKLNMIYSSSIEAISKIIEESDLVIIRGNYREWSKALKFIRCNYVFLPCNSRVLPNNLAINIDKERCHVFVDDNEIVREYSKLNYKAYIFKKPAMFVFYQNHFNVKKDIDLILICSRTDRPHKRVDLFIDSLIYLDKITDVKINAVIAGNSSFHKEKIESLKLNMVSLSAANNGKRLGKSGLIQLLDRSKIKVCTSSIDANPRVISESMARNVPVLCAEDLRGGKFQINPKTGMFFRPSPKCLAEKSLEALSKLETFSPKEHCNKISDAVEQLLGLLK